MSEEERFRTVDHGDFYAIAPILPELRLGEQIKLPLKEEYSSARDLMAQDQIIALLHQQKLMVEDVVENGQELLR